MNTENKKIRTRFAPSPTGFVHIGSLRTALFAFLFARHNGGVNILRVEDTDQNRLVEGAAENLVKVLNSLGIEFDEGFYLDEYGKLVQRGEYGPYLQSQRLGYYEKYVKELIENGGAYYCFCDEKTLEEVRAEQVALKQPPMYNRVCRKLSADEVAGKLAEFSAANKRPVVRQAVPESGQTIIHDLIYKDIVYENRILDDQILLKSDGFPTYHLAVVVDDHEMQISHVIRGEEWIPSTPKHLLLYKAFGWDAPQFGHLPLILNADKSKLSKRQGDVAVEDFLKKGYFPEALLNFVAFLGWNPKTEKEIFSLTDLIAEFDLAKVNKASAVFDLKKLDWLNGLYIRKESTSDLTQKLIPHWVRDGYLTQEAESIFLPHFKNQTCSLEYLEAISGLEKDRLKKLSEIGERTAYFFKPLIGTDYTELLVSKKSSVELTKTGLELVKKFFEEHQTPDLSIQTIEEKIKAMIEVSGLGNFDVLWPMRVALTGLPASPNPFEVAWALNLGLGKAEIIERLDSALAFLQS